MNFTPHIVAIAAIVSLLLGSTYAGAADRTLVQDGQPKATIIVQANDAKSQKAAAALQTYIEKISGAKLPLVNEGQPVPLNDVLLLVGHTQAAGKLGLKIPQGYDASIRDDSFEEEGYILKTDGNQVFIAGNNDGPYQGTIFAAFALLENLGCRFYFPGEWGEVIPERRTIVVSDLDIHSKPAFPVRNIWFSGWVPTSAKEREIYGQWGTKVGFSAGSPYPTVGDGFLGFLIPPKEFGATHPEYFAMNKAGERKVGTDPQGTMFCLSNPDVFTQSVANLREAFAGKRKMINVTSNGFGISPPDGAPFCYCDKCLAESNNFNYPTYVHERLQSEEFFAFASRLAKEFPDKFVSTFAYALREMPPQGVALPHNVMVMYAPISCDVMHPHDSPLWRHAEFISMLRQYRRQTPHVTIYDYNPGFLTGCFVPERDAENMAVNAPLYKEIGIKGMSREGRKAFMQTWLSYYVTAKLLWDPHADLGAIKKDFYTNFFGPDAGPHVQAWWDACAQRLVEAPIQAHEDWVINHVYNLEFVAGLQKHVDAARAAGGTVAQKGRVEAFALIADHLLAYAQMNDAESRMDYGAASAFADRMTQDKKRLYDIYPFFIEVDKIPANGKPRSYFAEGRKVKFDELKSMTDGTKGTLLAPLPPAMKFSRDPYNSGVPNEWYASGFNDASWGTKNTFMLWDQQDPVEDAAGHDYMGYGWYRGTVKIPDVAPGRPVKFWCGGITNEGWIWINGQFAGHKSHALWWMAPHDFELDVSKFIKPGQENTITIRVLKDSELGGLYRRGFFYTPNP